MGARVRKITVCQITQKLSSMDPMLLHKFNINMALPVCLIPKLSLYDLPNPRYDLPYICAAAPKKGVAHRQGQAFSLK